MKEHVFRLSKGDYLKESLLSYMKDNNISSAVVLCAVGSLLELNIRLADAKDYLVSKDHYEIVSLIGTLCSDSCHLHISVSDNKGRVFGGHLENGNIINTTCEIVLGELEEYQLCRAYDESTGYKELQVERKL